MVDHIGIMHDGALKVSEPVETLLARVKRVRLLYDADPPAQLTVPGLVRSRQEAHETVLIVDNFQPSTGTQPFSNLGAKSIIVEDLPLEDAFIELAGKREGRVK